LPRPGKNPRPDAATRLLYRRLAGRR
jgi:hypothetical protein